MSSIWNFLKRHRRKFMFVGALAGGSYLALKYAYRKLQEIQEREATECLTLAKKQHHFDSNQRICNTTVLGTLSTLRENLMKQIDTETLTTQLKLNPEKKIEIWNLLKVLGFTRALTSVYCCCNLVLCLRVQLNIIGGYMFLDSIPSKSEAGPTFDALKATPEIQQKYMDNVHYIIGDGLAKLSSTVEEAVRSVLENVSLKDKLSLTDIQNIVAKVRLKVEDDNGHGREKPMTRFILPETVSRNQGCLSQREWLLLEQIQGETMDIIESKDMQTILKMCLDTSFMRLLDRVSENYCRESSNGPKEFNFNPNTQTIAMAKLIPVMNGLVHLVCAEPPNQFVQELLLKPEVKNFAANVYEAFSQTDPQHEMI